MSKNNSSDEPKTGPEKKAVPVDQEFWDFLNSPESRNLLQSFISQILSGGGIDDPEDIISRIKLKYARKGALRPPELHQGTLRCLARRQVIDYKREVATKKRGNGVVHLSLDAGELLDLDSFFSEQTTFLAGSCVSGMLIEALSAASKVSDGKQLIVIQALLRWMKSGFKQGWWTDELSAREVEEFTSLKKGKSLEGKVSATFTKVKKKLREIIVREGLLEN